MTTQRWLVLVAGLATCLAAGLTFARDVETWRREARLERERVWYEEGRVTAERYLHCSRALLDWRLLLTSHVGEQIAAAGDHLARARHVVESEENCLETMWCRSGVADLVEAKNALEEAEFLFESLARR
jgi:hypothetical protein